MPLKTNGNLKSAEAKALLDSTLRQKRVGHRIAKQARERLMHEILTSSGERVIALIGPSGVGKTLIVKTVQERLLEHYMEEMNSDPGFLPFISVEAVTGMNGSYDWRDGFARMLTAANEPLIGLKRFAPELQLDGQKITTTKGLLKSEFRRSFESLVKHRRVKVVFIDEGSAIIDETVNKHPLRQFNILKSLAVSLGIVIVLIGAYDLAGVNDGNGQLLNRSVCIHMPRYQPDMARLEAAVNGTRSELDPSKEPDDIDEFMRAVLTLQTVAPVTIDPGVLEDVPLILTKSVGCFGNAFRWFARACGYALTYNNGRVTKEIFESEALPNDYVLKLALEADVGEKLLADCSKEVLATHFGLSALNAKLDEPSDVPTNAKKPSRAVGKRGPSRDPVGMTHA